MSEYDYPEITPDEAVNAVRKGRRSRQPEREHKPEPLRVQSRCRVDCSCGWRGPVVSMFGEGHAPWVEHFKEAQR